MRRSSTLIATATLTLVASVVPLTRGAAQDQAHPDAHDARMTREQRVERNVQDLRDISLMLSWLDLRGDASARPVAFDDGDFGSRDVHLAGDVASGDLPATSSGTVFERATRDAANEMKLSTTWNADILRAARERRDADELARLAADRRASDARAALRANASSGPYTNGSSTTSRLPGPPRTHVDLNQTPVGVAGGGGAVHNPTAGDGAVHNPGATLTPEPATLFLLATGLAALFIMQRRQRATRVTSRQP